jgi:transposase
MSSKRYTPEFRAEAVRQVPEREYPVSEVARRLGVGTFSLYKWLKEASKTPCRVPRKIFAPRMPWPPQIGPGCVNAFQ